MKIISVMLFSMLGLLNVFAVEYKEIEQIKKIYEIGVIMTYQKNNATPSNIEIIYKKNDVVALANLRSMLFSPIQKKTKLAKPFKEILFRSRKGGGKSTLGLIIINYYVRLTKLNGDSVKVPLLDFKRFLKK